MKDNPRSHKRFPLFAIAELKMGNEQIIAMVDNFSLTGMGLYCLHPVQVHTPVEALVKFVTKEGLQNSDTIKGTVVWTVKYDNIYMMGIAFDEPLSEETHPSLYKLYHNLLEMY